MKRVVIRVLIENRWNTELLQRCEYSPIQGIVQESGDRSSWVCPKGKRYLFWEPSRERSWRVDLLEIHSNLQWKVTVSPLWGCLVGREPRKEIPWPSLPPPTLRALRCSLLSRPSQKPQGLDPINFTLADHLKRMERGPGGANRRSPPTRDQDPHL